MYPLLDILSDCLAAISDLGIGDFRSRVFVGRGRTKTFRVTGETTPKQVNVLYRPLSTSPHARSTHLLYVSRDFAFVLYGEALYWTPTSFRAIIARRGQHCDNDRLGARLGALGVRPE